MASIGRVKPYVYSGVDPDPNAVTLRAPGFPPPQDLPQPSDPYPGARTGDLYLDTITGDVYTLTGSMVTKSFYPGQPIAMV
jgi:hypothetical protein